MNNSSEKIKKKKRKELKFRTNKATKKDKNYKKIIELKLIS